jgi:hypothetical protein
LSSFSWEIFPWKTQFFVIVIYKFLTMPHISKLRVMSWTCGTVTENDPRKVERIFSTILENLSRILIKNNISLQAAVELLKRELVGAALRSTNSTDSRISLQTGVHRKDVKRLRDEIEGKTSRRNPTKGLAVLLSTWSNDLRFCEPDGRRRHLLRKGTEDNPGFDALVKAAKIDLAPATVLQELQAQSLVAIHADDRIELLSPTFVAQSGDAALDAFAATITDHLRIAADNVMQPHGAPRQFDQVLRYSHLSSASVEKLEAEARIMARDYLEKLNAMAHQLQSDDDASGTLTNGRFVAGVFIAPTHPADYDQSTTPKREKDK